MVSLMQHVLSPILLSFLTLCLTIVGTAKSRGQGSQPPLTTCIDAVGTYLTINNAKGETSGSFRSRSLISLTNGGHAFLTDTGEGGEPDFGPFSDGRGAWRCVSNEGGVTRFAATVLDFTFVTASHPKQLIGRLDILGAYDAGAQKLIGKMALYLLPISSDPFAKLEQEANVVGAFEGKKIVVP